MPRGLNVRVHKKHLTLCSVFRKVFFLFHLFLFLFLLEGLFFLNVLFLKSTFYLFTILQFGRLEFLVLPSTVNAIFFYYDKLQTYTKVERLVKKKKKSIILLPLQVPMTQNKSSINIIALLFSLYPPGSNTSVPCHSSAMRGLLCSPLLMLLLFLQPWATQLQFAGEWGSALTNRGKGAKTDYPSAAS